MYYGTLRPDMVTVDVFDRVRSLTIAAVCPGYISRLSMEQQPQQQPTAQNPTTGNQSANEQIQQAKKDINQSPTMTICGLQSYETVAQDEGVENPTVKFGYVRPRLNHRPLHPFVASHRRNPSTLASHPLQPSSQYHVLEHFSLAVLYHHIADE